MLFSLCLGGQIKNPDLCIEEMLHFLYQGSLKGDWLLIQSLEWSKIIPNRSKCFASLHKIQERNKGRTDETQDGADEALTDV